MSERRYYITILAFCIAVSSYGITAGRPVLQIGALQFPYAETLPFPYPLTTALFQLICTCTCLLFAGCFTRSVTTSLDDLEGRKAGRLMSAGNSRHTISAINWVALRGIFPLGATLAAEAALGSYVLYHMPFEAYLLSRALVIPFFLLFDRFVYKSFSAGKLICPSIVLSITVFITAFRSSLPYSGRMAIVAIFSAGVSALWPLQVQSRIKSTESSSKGEYEMVNTAETTLRRDVGTIYTTWSLLYYTSMVSVIVLLPIVLFSGEPGYILRNCYFLSEHRFWVYMCTGAIFRFALLSSTMFLIQRASAVTAVFFYILVSVTQIMFFTFDKLRPIQLAGLEGAFFISIWFLVSLADFEVAWRSSWADKHPGIRRILYFTTIMVAAGIGFKTVTQILHNNGPVDTSPHLDGDQDGDSPASLYTAMTHGTDAYLGTRPPVNSFANFQLMMSECGEMQESNTRDVYRCLEYLATKQEDYLMIPMETLQARSVDGELEAAAKGCDGPIIPYHIWWSGPPTWRVELFIKAYLYTQNLHCSRLWIWINGQNRQNIVDAWLHDQRFERFVPLVNSSDIILREFRLPAQVPLPAQSNFDELDKARYYSNPGWSNSRGERSVADSIIRDTSGQEWLKLYDDANQITYYDKALSDVARFIIIHLHGGIYLDSGTVLLRDIRPLLLRNMAFIEKPDPKEPFGNALIAIPANSSISSYVLRGGIRMGLFFHAAVLQRMFVQEGRDGNNYDGGLVRLEDAIFDPIWAESHGQREGRCTVPCLSSYASVFKAALVHDEWQSFDGEPLGVAAYNRTLENFYRGAFAYHIHGQKKTSYERGSWMDVICIAHDRFFAGERTNSYGEKWTGPAIANYRFSSSKKE